MSSIIMRSLSRPLVGFFLTFSFSVFAVAEVDIKSGTFSITRSDQSLDTELVGFDASRTYNSTVSHNGLFGKGWCSGFETRLTAVAAGQLMLTECGAGAVKFFNSPEFKETHIAQTAELIVGKMQKAGETVRADLKEEIIRNPVLREKLVLKHEIKFTASKSAYRLSSQPDSEQVIYKSNQYVLKTAAGLTQNFDERGRLTLQRHEHGDSIRLSYDKNGLKQMKSLRGLTISFKLNTNGYVTEMRGPAELSRYTYTDAGYLTEVSQRSGREKYTYNDGLLVAVEGGIEKTRVKYNPSTRFVAQVAKDDCVVDYAYKIEKSALRFNADVRTTCKSAPVSQAKFEFQYAQAADGSLFQKRMVATDGKGGLTSAEYQGEGQPTKIVRKGETYQFKYDHKNRLVGRETSAQRIEYAYGNTGQMINAKVYSKKGKKSAAPVLQQFNYDKSARLSSVVLKNNVIQYGYDLKGRLNSIRSKRGPAFEIKHDAATGRIVQIKAAKHGHFQMEYAANGKLTKNKWHGDINKAMAVLEEYETVRAPYDQSFDFGVLR